MRSWIDGLLRLLARGRSFFLGTIHRRRIEAEMSEEFRSHIEMRTDDLIRAGMTREAAEREALREFGPVDAHRDAGLDARGLRSFDRIRFSWLDVKLGARMLLARPGLTLVSMFALGLGIPAGLAPVHLASIIEAPLPEDTDNRIRAIRFWDPATTGVSRPTIADFELWSEELSAFDGVGAVYSSTVNVSRSDATSPPTIGAVVTPSVFEILGTPPALGRTLQSSDAIVDAPNVVVLGHDVWNAQFGADPEIVGQTVRVGGVTHTVVGVMPEGFLFPALHQLWVPLSLGSADPVALERRVQVIGLLGPEADVGTAQAELDRVGLAELRAPDPARSRLQPEVVPYIFSFVGAPRAGLPAMPEYFLFSIIAGALLFVACGNVAMLTFARTATRYRELAVRAALGASRSRLVVQIFVETQLLALLAAATGLGLVDFALRNAPLEVVLGEPMPYWLSLGVGRETVLWALVLATLSATIAGVVPALRITGKGVQDALRQKRWSRASRRFGGVTGVLIAGDVAVSVAVLAFTFAVGRHLTTSADREELVGIPADEFLAVEVRMPSVVGLGADDRADEFETRLASVHASLLERLQAEPDVRAATLASALPRMDQTSRVVDVEDVAPPQGDVGRWMRMAWVDVSYFDELDQEIHAGRDFTHADAELEGPRPVIVNTAFVSEILGGGDAIGRRLRFVDAGGGSAPWHEIIGVVGHLGMSIIDEDGDPGIYRPLGAGELNPFQLAVHVGAAPETIVPRLREIVSEVEPNLVLGDPRVLSSIKQGDWYIMVAAAGMMSVLLAILVALASSGIYAIVAHSVSERTREIGVRSALGAPTIHLAWTVLARSATQVAVGALIGIPVAGWLLHQTAGESGGAAAAMSTGLALALGLGVVGVIATASCTMPMRRMLGIKASEALRAEG